MPAHQGVRRFCEESAPGHSALRGRKLTSMRRSGELSAQQRSLLEIMREHQFGRVENMPVRAGQPILGRELKVVRVSRLGGESGGTKPPGPDEFELKRAVCDLFDELARLGNGTVVKLEFKRGLPCRLETTPHEMPGTHGATAGAPVTPRPDS
jgi:hypothetical protein